MTEKLYYKDAYLKEFTAKILEVKDLNDNTCLIKLDRTAFYPEGGGQLPDAGILEFNDGIRANITDVQEMEGEIWHTAKLLSLNSPSDDNSDILSDSYFSDAGKSSNMHKYPAAGNTVRGTIDWERRFDHMQQHSGEHIVSGMICSSFQCNNVGFHMGEEIVTIDYDTRISFDQVLRVEAMANAYIWEDHRLLELRPSEEELKTMAYRSKKDLDGDVRITSFPGADTCACCGTHVSSSAQVGLVKFISAKNFHDGTRLELLCGKRAADFLIMNYAENKKIAVMLSAREDKTFEYVNKLADEISSLKASVSILEDKLISKWVENCKRREYAAVIDDSLNAIQGRRLADALSDVCPAALVFTKTDTGYNYAVIKKDHDISDFIKSLNTALNGRGGGRNGFAQGSVKADKDDIELFLKNIKPASDLQLTRLS